MSQEANDIPSQPHDMYIPKPVVHCPITGDVLLEWFGTEGPCAGVTWREKQAAPDLGDRADEPGTESLEELRLTKDVRVEAFSPFFPGGKLRVRLHCFVRDGVWQDSEICEVRDLKTDKLYYTTDS